MKVKKEFCKMLISRTLVCLFYWIFSSISYASVQIEVIYDETYEQKELVMDDIGYSIFNKILEHSADELKLKLLFMHFDRVSDWLLLERNNNVCLFNKVINSERESTAYFSKSPIVVFPSNRLILNIHSTLLGSVSLKDVVEGEKLRIGYVKGRSYGEDIDKQIDKYKTKMIAISGDNGSIRLRDIFFQNKLDGIIEYSEVFIRDINDEETLSKFSFHQIKRAKAFTFGHVACSKTQIGKKAIKIINQVINKRKIREFIVSEHKRMFSKIEGEMLEKRLNKIWLNKSN